MKSRLIDGKAAAEEILQSIKRAVAASVVVPCLAVVLVGDDPASASYVRNKQRAAARVGIATRIRRLPARATGLPQLLAEVDTLNADASVHGVLVQLPLPPHLRASEAAVLERVSAAKDVDPVRQARVTRP